MGLYACSLVALGGACVHLFSRQHADTITVTAVAALQQQMPGPVAVPRGAAVVLQIVRSCAAVCTAACAAVVAAALQQQMPGLVAVS